MSAKTAPIPRYMVTTAPIRKTVVAIGRRKGFWNLLTFSMLGSVERVGGLAHLGGVEHGEGNDTGDRAEDDDAKDQDVVGPERFAVGVVAHALL
jgi:hypothetical protein